jgi:tetratricopeptide (TPR) repeat protein
MVYVAMDDLASAIPYFAQATQLDPSYPTAVGQLGTAYYLQRDYARAQEPLERAIQIERSPARLSAYQHVLGWTYFNNGALDRAEAAFQQALTIDPDLDGARQGLEAVAAARASVS